MIDDAIRTQLINSLVLALLALLSLFQALIARKMKRLDPDIQEIKRHAAACAHDLALLKRRHAVLVARLDRRRESQTANTRERPFASERRRHAPYTGLEREIDAGIEEEWHEPPGHYRRSGSEEEPS